MRSITRLESTAAPFERINVDTDLIIPKQFLKTITRKGLGKSLFYDLRYDEAGNDRQDFVLNQPHYKKAQILICGANFGCGSSREHAVWALDDFGFRALIGSSFADIFSMNCIKNGIMTAVLDKQVVDQLIDQCKKDPEAKLVVDLSQQVVIDSQQQKHTFAFDPMYKERLLNGWDDIDLTLKNNDAIAKYERDSTASTPWNQNAIPS